MNFFVKSGCNLVIDRKLNTEWKEIPENEVLNFLDNKGLVWHKDLIQDEAVIIFQDDKLSDGECKVLTAELEDNLTECSVIVDLQYKTK